MSVRAPDPLRLDVAAFAAAGGRLRGAWPLGELGRLAAAAHEDAQPGADASAAWQAEGEARAQRGGPPQPWLHVEASAALSLVCQRCLGPVATMLEARRSFLFVDDEQRAAALDADMEDDVLVLPRALDLRALVEDELLLALPLVPRHAVCPEPLPMPAQPEFEEAESPPHPFAALGRLRKPGGGG